MRRLRSLIWGLLSLLAAPLAPAAELREVRLWESPDSTRVVFDLSAETQHKVFALENPARIVVDIHGVDPIGVGVANAAPPKGTVRQIRSGVREDGSLRVVLDMAHSVTPKSFTLSPNAEYGFRLVLDLHAGDARAEPEPAPQPALRMKEKPIVVAVDAGHGGEDPGARGATGLLEKDVALSLARRLAQLVNAEPGMQAVLTRDGDYYLGLRERVAIARKHQADLFVSVHANAFKNRDMRGSAVYVLSNRGASNEHARWLAQKENAADLVGGMDLHGKDNELAAVLIDLSQSATMEASFDVGSRILGSMSRVNALQRSEVQQAAFMVLKAPDIPSVLVETAFITNPQEERMLRDSGHQEKFARSMLDGIKGYFQSYRPQQQMVEERGLKRVSYSEPR